MEIQIAVVSWVHFWNCVRVSSAYVWCNVCICKSDMNYCVSTHVLHLAVEWIFYWSCLLIFVLGIWYPPPKMANWSCGTVTARTKSMPYLCGHHGSWPVPMPLRAVLSPAGVSTTFAPFTGLWTKSIFTGAPWITRFLIGLNSSYSAVLLLFFVG